MEIIQIIIGYDLHILSTYPLKHFWYREITDNFSQFHFRTFFLAKISDNA